MSKARDIADSAATINALDGVTATGTELNILDGVTATTSELNILDGVTATATELNTLDALTRGSIIYGNSSGATAELTKGTANQVLTSDGTDIAWADGGGGVWEVVQTYSPSSASSVDVTAFSSTYDHYMLVVHELTGASVNDLKFELKVDNAFKGANYYWYRDRFFQGGTYDFATGSNESAIDCGQSRYLSGQMFFYDVNNSSTGFPGVVWDLKSTTYSSTMSWSWGKGIFNGTMTSTALQGIKIKMGGAAMTGTVTLYGLKSS